MDSEKAGFSLYVVLGMLSVAVFIMLSIMFEFQYLIVIVLCFGL